MGNKELLVSAIENGTVIDHIPTNKTFQVVNLLHLQDMDTPEWISWLKPRYSSMLAAAALPAAMARMTVANRSDTSRVNVKRFLNNAL